MLVVALSGKMGHGKTTVAQYLVNNYGFERMGFSDKLKEHIRDMIFAEKDIQEKPDWMRKLMQAYGAARRATDPDYWSERLIEELCWHRWGPDEYIVIDDLRFENEIEALEKWAEETGNDLEIIRIAKEEKDYHKVFEDNDPTEVALDYYDFKHIVRAKPGQIKELCDQVYSILAPYIENGPTPSNSI
jgi:hypothetical protein